MQCVILAGGMGTRISEESHLKPKPMIEIGGRPMLWHIMKIYSHYGIHDFIICLGYKGYLIKEYFANYFMHMSDITFDMKCNEMTVHHKYVEPWRVTLVDTGEQTMTGGRLRRVREYLREGPFCFTYGDGVSDVDITALIAFHRSHGKMATVTAIQPAGRYGALDIRGDAVAGFQEKPVGDGAWINGGFFVLEPGVIDRIGDDMMIWERSPMETLAMQGELKAYRHRGFWHAMDTLRDRLYLEELWSRQGGKPPWKVWE
jgi:glucose-1-phosphate cytidylyltransferase